jgi:APA family basic amino acid/polyamine antiporter
MTQNPDLARRLGTVDAAFIGLGSMIGAGIFASFAPAAGAAGAGLLIGLLIAACVAYCNASSSAQLAAQYPTSGGTYIYGRERLGEWWGFFAGWSFVVGKTASCAAMALTFAAYAAPAGWQKPVAVAAILVVAGVNYVGVTRTASLTKIIVTFVLAVLVIVVIAGAAGGIADAGNLSTDLFGHGWYGILQSAGLLFFAFAGYARIATMGEEVKNPRRTIPRAILAALSITLVLYAVIAVTVLLVVGPKQLATAAAPLVDVVTVSGWSWAAPVVRAGAAAASLGALLALVAGVGRTSLAMARNRDLPRWLAAVHPKYKVPHHAEVVVAVVVAILVLTVDLRGAIGFSSFGVLLYYLIANAAALTQTSADRRYPKAVQVVGALGCLILVATLPLVSIAVGLGVVALGIVYRLSVLRVPPKGPPGSPGCGSPRRASGRGTRRAR